MQLKYLKISKKNRKLHFKIHITKKNVCIYYRYSYNNVNTEYGNYIGIPTLV